MNIFGDLHGLSFDKALFRALLFKGTPRNQRTPKRPGESFLQKSNMYVIRCICSAGGLSVSGSKAELIDRVLSSPSTGSICSMTTPNLRKALRARGVEASGNRTEVLVRMLSSTPAISSINGALAPRSVNAMRPASGMAVRNSTKMPKGKSKKSQLKKYVQEVKKMVNAPRTDPRWHHTMWKCHCEMVTSKIGKILDENSKLMGAKDPFLLEIAEKCVSVYMDNRHDVTGQQYQDAFDEFVYSLEKAIRAVAPALPTPVLSRHYVWVRELYSEISQYNEDITSNIVEFIAELITNPPTPAPPPPSTLAPALGSNIASAVVPSHASFPTSSESKGKLRSILSDDSTHRTKRQRLGPSPLNMVSPPPAANTSMVAPMVQNPAVQVPSQVPTNTPSTALEPVPIKHAVQQMVKVAVTIPANTAPGQTVGAMVLGKYFTFTVPPMAFPGTNVALSIPADGLEVPARQGGKNIAY